MQVVAWWARENQAAWSLVCDIPTFLYIKTTMIMMITNLPYTAHTLPSSCMRITRGICTFAFVFFANYQHPSCHYTLEREATMKTEGRRSSIVIKGMP
jgi:hypothetical protein